MAAGEPQINPVMGQGLGEYLGVFARRLGVILVPFILLVGVSIALGFLLPAEYTASTRMKVAERGFLDRFYQRTGFAVPNEPFLATVPQDAETRLFLKDIVDRLGVTEGFDVSDPRQRELLYSRVIENLDVGYDEDREGPDLISVTYSGRDAVRVARFVNAVRQKIERRVTDELVREVARVRSQINREYQKIKGRVDEAAAALESFRERNKFRLVGEDMLETRAEELAREVDGLAEDRRRLDGLRKELDSVVAELRSTKAVERKVLREPNPEYVEARKKVMGLEQKLQLWKSKGYTEAFKPLQRLKSAVALAREQLKLIPKTKVKEEESEKSTRHETLMQRRGELEGRIENLQAQIEARRKSIAGLREQVQGSPAMLREQERLQAALESARARERMVFQQLQKAEETYERVVSKDSDMFSVLSAPTREEALTWDPVFPNVPLFIGVGAVVGLLLGSGLAFLMEFASQSYVTTNQLRRGLPVPVLGGVEPILTRAERRRCLRRRLALAVLALAVLATVVWVHVLYFDEDLQQRLPPWMFDLMRKIYGSQ